MYKLYNRLFIEVPKNECKITNNPLIYKKTTLGFTIG